MSESIGLWVGFSFHVCHKADEDGKRMHVTLKGNGVATTDPATAWQDALRLAAKNEKYLEDQGYRITVAELGVQPAHFA